MKNPISPSMPWKTFVFSSSRPPQCHFGMTGLQWRHGRTISLVQYAGTAVQGVVRILKEGRFRSRAKLSTVLLRAKWTIRVGARPKLFPAFAPCTVGSAFTETAGSWQIVSFGCFAPSGPNSVQNGRRELLNVLICRMPRVADYNSTVTQY